MIVIPVYHSIILPGVQYNLESGFLSNKEAEELSEEDEVLIALLKETMPREKLTPENFYPYGVLGNIKYLREGEEGVFITVKTEVKVLFSNIKISEDEVTADFDVIAEEDDITKAEKKAAVNTAMEMITKLTRESFQDFRDRRFSERFESVNEIISIIAPYTDLSAEEKYKILEASSLKKRTELIMEAFGRYYDISVLQREISRKIHEKQNENYREGIVRRQLSYLQDELKELNPEESSDADKIAKALETAGITEEARSEIDRVFARFKNLSREDHEYASLLDYLLFVTSLSWKAPDEAVIDMKKAKEVLDKSHYGLKKAKDRIIEQIAVMALKKKNSGSILLLTGAPGTGKTSIGKAIAEALDRKYMRISLGGIKDEAEIRGHRRTYIGAMPGRIMDAIRKSGVNNPVIVLDEVDKLGMGNFNGDPESALLEVLDPEQNVTFTDHYMNVPFDLSNVLFICTANDVSYMSSPLLDRMEMIELSGYTDEEKFHIGKEYLFPKALEEAGLLKKNVGLSDSVLKKIIEDYTMEAGVRGLKKQLDKILRQIAVAILLEEKTKVTVKLSDLPKYLGTKKAFRDKILKRKRPGVVTGLAYTEAGGDILFIETSVSKGSGTLTVTGQLGDVMKESASIALSLIKVVLENKKLNFKEMDIHIHVPAGAIPKDGPSAGITLFTALLSLFLEKSVDPTLAMTGEVSLRGQVLPIGGLPEKLMAAKRAGIKKVLVPLLNKDDLSEVPAETKEALEIIFADSIKEVAKESLHFAL